MTQQPSQAVVIKSEDREITISFNDVKQYLCPLASDAEIGLFLKVCASENLNPFRKDCFLVKYKEDQAASIIIATDVFIRSAENSPDFDGYEAGIILKPIDPKDKPEFREGAFLMDNEENRLAGGWARIFRKDRTRPFYSAVNIKECIKYTKYGKPTRFWEEMPATMVRKVALSRALRESFGNRFSGTYAAAEVEEIPEGGLSPALENSGQLPQAYEKANGEKNWRKFWARVKSELGLTTEQARELLHVDSIKKDLIDQGVTMEKIWDSLINALQGQKDGEQVIDVQTGEITQEEDLFPDKTDTRGEFEREGIDIIEETKHANQPEPESPGEIEGYIDHDWLTESLRTLRDKGIKSCEESNLLAFMKKAYKVEGKTVLESAAKLKHGPASHFTKKIQETLDMA